MTICLPSIGRHFSIGLSHFCTPWECSFCSRYLFKDVQGYLCSEQPWNIEIMSLSRAEENCSLSCIIKINISLQGKVWAGLLSVHHRNWRLPKLGVPQLWNKPTACPASTWAPPHHPRGTCGARRIRQPCSACYAMSNKALCLWSILERFNVWLILHECLNDKLRLGSLEKNTDSFPPSLLTPLNKYSLFMFQS